jgi:hypothetical protein
MAVSPAESERADRIRVAATVPLPGGTLAGLRVAATIGGADRARLCRGRRMTPVSGIGALTGALGGTRARVCAYTWNAEAIDAVASELFVGTGTGGDSVITGPFVIGFCEGTNNGGTCGRSLGCPFIGDVP